MTSTVDATVAITGEQTAASGTERTLLLAEIDRLFSVLSDPGQQAMAALFLYSGLSTGEARALKVGDVDTRARQLVVEGKRHKSRVVSLNETALPYLEAIVRDRRAAEPLFPGYGGGGPLTSRAIQRYFERASRKAGLALGVVSPNSLRRTFATTEMSKSGDLLQVAETMGIRPEGVARLVTPIGPRSSAPPSAKSVKLKARTGAHRGGRPLINVKRDRQWWVEYYERDRTYQQIADAAGVKRNTVAKAVAAEQQRRVNEAEGKRSTDTARRGRPQS